MAGWVQVLGTVATVDALPASVEEGQGYIVSATGNLWAFQGGVWVEQSTGSTMIPPGVATSAWIQVLGVLTHPTDLPAVAEENQGYVVLTNDVGETVNHLWAFQGGGWVDTGIVITSPGVTGDNPIPPESPTLLKAMAYTDQEIAAHGGGGGGGVGATGPSGPPGATGPVGAGSSTTSDPPASPITGQLWVDIDTGQLFVWFDSTWVELGGVGGTGLDFNITVGPDQPADPEVNDVWIVTTT